jgi:hypothetical protein
VTAPRKRAICYTSGGFESIACWATRSRSVLEERKAKSPFVREAGFVQPALQAWFARVLFANRTKTETEVIFSFVSSRQVPQINQ